MLLTRRSADRTILLNMLAEFIASALYSAIYFVLIGRYVSAAHDLGYVVLAYGIGLGYLAAVYIPFHTYRIHILPFITVMTAVRKNRWRLLWHKLPAQLAGAFAGVGIFCLFDGMAPFGDYSHLTTLRISDFMHVAVLNGLGAAVICYVFYLVRTVFQQRNGMGTVLISLLIASLFLITGTVQGVSVLNPFGMLALNFMSPEAGLHGAVLTHLLIHVVVPVSLSVSAFYLAKALNGKRSEDRTSPVVSPY